MHFRCPPGLPSRAHGSEIDPIADDLAKVEDALAAAEAPPQRPFVERRRSRRIEQSWPEAIDALHQVLLGFENANKELAESESRYRTIFEDAPVGIFQVDRHGRPLSLNSAMSKVFGYESRRNSWLKSRKNKDSACLTQQNGMRLRRPSEKRTCAALISRSKVETAKPNGYASMCVQSGKKAASVRYEGTGEDVSERRRIEARNERLAYSIC